MKRYKIRAVRVVFASHQNATTQVLLISQPQKCSPGIGNILPLQGCAVRAAVRIAAFMATIP